jgi:hypothetical protein
MSRWYKNIHIGLSLFKLIVGLVVLVLVGLYIDPFQDPETGVIIWSIGLLFFVWGAAYFAFYFAWLWWSDKKVHLISSYAYKASLLIALYLLSNIILIVIELRSPANGLIVLILFWLLYWFLFYRPAPEQHTSIDMIIGEKSK